MTETMPHPIEINKIQKIALLITFHTQIVPIEEAALLLMISWVVNGVDNAVAKNGQPRINWEPYLQFAEQAHREMYETQEDTQDETPVSDVAN